MINLPLTATEDQLKEFFITFGMIRFLRIFNSGESQSACLIFIKPKTARMVLKSKEKVFFGHPIKILPYSEHYNTKDDSDGDEGPTEGNSRWGNGLERKYSYTEEPTLQSLKSSQKSHVKYTFEYLFRSLTLFELI